jgi:hypothetical protein
MLIPVMVILKMAHFVAKHLKIQEPDLLFNLKEGSYRTSNPMEGLLNWGSYDASIPGYIRPNPIRIAIISTEKGFPTIVNHLQKLNQFVKLKTHNEYLRDYPGFNRPYRTNFSFPQNRQDRLVSLISTEELKNVGTTREPEIQFLELLKRKIQPFITDRSSFAILIIHIPQEASAFRQKIEPQYRFDLHDSLKAYSAPNGVKIQVIEDRSITYIEPARVYWWLSLALYVKANGIPWKIADANLKTAYVGLTFGIKPGTTKDRIVLGCSQVFDEKGEGLRFLLFPLENPVWRSKNPFMTQEDARRLFSLVRKTYQDMNNARPERVVVHKTTYFSGDEIKGISEALDGIDEMELLTIYQSTPFRAIQSEARSNNGNNIEISNWPVMRGTVEPLDAFSFLLWTQGDVLGIGGKYRHFYQEGRGIPAPLLVKRFRGRMPLEEVASDILKLTKMNWNNLQFYNRLPVTISFAQKISNIVKQIDSYSEVPYDFTKGALGSRLHN